jgi:hypothetical protein
VGAHEPQLAKFGKPPTVHFLSAGATIGAPRTVARTVEQASMATKLKGLQMQLAPRKSQLSLRPVAVTALLLLLSCAPAVNASGALRFDQPANVILSQLQLIQADAKAGKNGWDNISVEKKTEFASMQERVFALLEGKGSAADLQQTEQADLANALERINALAKAADDERKVCKRERATGSNFPITTCSTVGELRRQREATQNTLHTQGRTGP